MKTILAINGSYRHGGITDQILEAFKRAGERAGARVEIVVLRDTPMEFCLNCRECTQQPGEQPGACVLTDNMAELIDAIEQADGYILASPTNFFSVTALFKRFQERLLVYAYWPWDMKGPKLRKAGEPRKKAIVVSSCAAPGPVGRLLYQTHKQLRITAKAIGAGVVGTVFTGQIAGESHPRLPERAHRKISRLVSKLL